MLIIKPGKMISDAEETDKLKLELRRCTDERNKLLQTTEQMRTMIGELEDHLKKKGTIKSSVQEQCEEQMERNRELEKEVQALQEELASKQGHRVGGPAKGLQAYEGMSKLALKKLLRNSEKEKVEIEWQSKEIEWRLDQEASGVSKAKEEREAIKDKLAQLKSQVGK